MSEGFSTETLRWASKRIAAKLEDCVDELNTLDGMLGDGDIGLTMVRGAQAVLQELPGLPDDLGAALMRCAQAFTKLSGSSFGTLLATGLMSAAKATKGRTHVFWSEISLLTAGAIDAMAKRGRSSLGDKTVLDALDAIRGASEGLDNPEVILHAAHQSVGEVLERFKSQPSKQGRARIFGEKSVGLYDPGQVVVKRVIDSLIDT